MRRHVFAALVAGTVLAAGAANAAIVTYNFTVELTDATEIGVNVGTLSTKTVTGSYSVDTSVAADGGSTASQAVFRGITAFSASYDGSTVTATPASSELQQDDAFDIFPDRYSVNGGGLSPAISIGGFSLLSAGFVLRDTDNTEVNDARNLLVDIELSEFEGRDFLAFFLNGTDLAIVYGTVTELTRADADVPAPAALLLLGTGLAILGSARRKAA